MHLRGLAPLGVLLLVSPSCSKTSVQCDADATTSCVSATADESAGCGSATSLTLGAYTEQSLTVGDTTRSYFVRLPNGYDASHPYPVVFEHHGCSSSADRQNNNVPLVDQIDDTAILVRGRAAANCWDTGASASDAAYTDALREEVDARWCVDMNRRYLTGYSGGAFMAHALACRRGAYFRGVATIAGGQNGSDCTPDMPALLIHDANDTTVNISASRTTRDGYIARNGCDADATPTAVTPDPCVASVACTAPVVYCETSGQGHDRQDALAAPAFWGFLSDLD